MIASANAVSEVMTVPQPLADGPVVEGEIDRDGDEDPADRTGEREHRGAHGRQRALGEFALHLRADDQEEQRQQRLVHPVGERVRGAEAAEPNFERAVPHRLIIMRDRQVGADQGDDRGDEQRPADDLIGSEERREAVEETGGGGRMMRARRQLAGETGGEGHDVPGSRRQDARAGITVQTARRIPCRIPWARGTLLPAGRRRRGLRRASPAVSPLAGGRAP